MAASDETPPPGQHDDTGNTGSAPISPVGDEGDSAPDFMAGEDFSSHEEFFAELERNNRVDDEAAKPEVEDFGFDEIGRDDQTPAPAPAAHAGRGSRAARMRTATRRRGAPPDGRRRPTRSADSPFANPRVRLLLGVALAVIVVAIVVFLVRNYERNRLVDGYTSYVNQSSQIAAASAALGPKLVNVMENSNGQSSTQLKADLDALVGQASAQTKQAQALDAPTGVQDANRALVLALQYRENALSALDGNLAAIIHSDSTTTASASIASSMERFLASDVIVQDSYLAETAQALRNESITGVSVPSTGSVVFLPGANQSYVLPSSAQRLVTSLRHVGTEASGQGAPHGLSLVSVVGEPGSITLTPGIAETIPESSNLHWAVTVQDGGGFVENNVKVSASLSYGSSPVDVQTSTITTINPGQQVVVSVPGPQASAVKLGTLGVLRVEVAPVPGEQNVANNAADYPITVTFN